MFLSLSLILWLPFLAAQLDISHREQFRTINFITTGSSQILGALLSIILSENLGDLKNVGAHWQKKSLHIVCQLLTPMNFYINAQFNTFNKSDKNSRESYFIVARWREHNPSFLTYILGNHPYMVPWKILRHLKVSCKI